MLEVLQHPSLVVQTEEQALTFVLTYVRRHALPHPLVRALFEHVRFPFLPNERLAQLCEVRGVGCAAGGVAVPGWWLVL